MEELKAQIRQLRWELSILNDVVRDLIPIISDSCPGLYCSECGFSNYCYPEENEYNT